MVKIGESAPGFSLVDKDGKTHSLQDFKGKQVVLYFYPKDDTPGCTMEAINFSRLMPSIEAKGGVVVGISSDSAKSHGKFCDKHDLKVLLLSDEDHVVQDAFGVWQEKSMMGKKYMGTVRSTFLIDASGRIQKIWDNVKVQGHDEDVLGSL